MSNFSATQSARKTLHKFYRVFLRGFVDQIQRRVQNCKNCKHYRMRFTKDFFLNRTTLKKFNLENLLNSRGWTGEFVTLAGISIPCGLKFVEKTRFRAQISTILKYLFSFLLFFHIFNMELSGLGLMMLKTGFIERSSQVND